MIDPKLLELIKQVVLEQIAKDICSVQPMPNIDYMKLAESPLWQSFVDRHFSHLKEKI